VRRCVACSNTRGEGGDRDRGGDLKGEDTVFLLVIDHVVNVLVGPLLLSIWRGAPGGRVGEGRSRDFRIVESIGKREERGLICNGGRGV
jgi:hypothetical protein